MQNFSPCKRCEAVTDVLCLKPLIDRISGCKIVMLGEASRGTDEFYSWRRIISQWLITKHGFNFIAVEGDWPDCQLIHQYAHGPLGDDEFTQPGSARPKQGKLLWSGRLLSL